MWRSGAGRARAGGARAAAGRAGAAGVPRARAPAPRRAAVPRRARRPRLPRQAADDGGTKHSGNGDYTSVVVADIYHFKNVFTRRDSKHI